ncbi:BTAD domain-containing putative transcriptional regulator [Streptomyces sp. NPDC002755]|uniref:AfsR/SARP family transcriptional regulator n=1 Tax=Streptomyces sp. NPDC002884 TaxID=3154544 RepID=UPI0033293B37
MGEELRFAVLGPVRAWRGSVEIDLGSPQQRVVLSALLLAEGSPVLKSELVGALWGIKQPVSGLGVLRNYIHYLRKALEPEGDAAGSIIHSTGTGYLLRVSESGLDLQVFRGLSALANQALRSGKVDEAAKYLRDALKLWQGPALANIRGEYAEAQRDRLGELRLSVEASCLRLETDLGAHEGVVAELSRLISAHPLDERFRAVLMLALYRSGRQAAALAAYRETQILLAEELGIDPGQELQALYQRILRADSELLCSVTPVPSAPVQKVPVPMSPVPAQLPSIPTAFVGRDSELGSISKISDSFPAAVFAIAGMAGVGKTTFAVHWARKIADRFPDGQLFLNLRGFDPGGTPMRTEHALRMLLESLGSDPHGLPQDMDALTGHYRTLLAGKRVLILLDNARDASQVRPLLPGAPGSVVIVTSRNQLPGLIAVDGAVSLSLDVLSAAEARVLLIRRLGEKRVTAEVDAVAEIIARCARLPLALAVIAARAATRPSFPLTVIVDELRANANSLDVFNGGDDVADVRAVFSWSYNALAPEAGRLFRMLSLHPGPDISLPAAASLACLTHVRTRKLLSDLTQFHLLNESVPGRYTFHDLVRPYATELAYDTDSQLEIKAARNRMLDHYLHTANGASLLVSPGRPMISLTPPAEGVRAEELNGDEGTARAWFTTELAVLLTVLGEAVVHKQDIHTWQLAWSMANYLHGRGMWREVEAVHHSAMEAACRLDSRTALAYAHRGIGTAMLGLGRLGEAVTHAERAIELFTEAGDLSAQAESYRTLASAVGDLGDLDAALKSGQRALDLLRESAVLHGGGDRTQVAIASALNTVGWYLARLGRHQQALSCCREALALFEKLGDYVNAANTWDSIAYAHYCLGRYDEAVTNYRNAITLDRQYGSPPWYAVGTHIRLGMLILALAIWSQHVPPGLKDSTLWRCSGTQTLKVCGTSSLNWTRRMPQRNEALPAPLHS